MSNTELFFEAMKCLWMVFWEADIIGKLILLGVAFICLGFILAIFSKPISEGTGFWSMFGKID